MSASLDALERAAALLGSDPNYRVTRALPDLSTLQLPQPQGRVRMGLVIDTETTGLDWRADSIIQIAACPVQIDGRGRVIGIGRTVNWLEDPGEPLTPEISRLTGLTDADLADQWIDDDALCDLLRDADLIIAHNAAFDRPWWEDRYSLARDKPWCCSLNDVDWRGQGFEGRGLGALLDQAGGWFNRRHRADADVDALVALLTITLPDGRTVASEMALTGSRPTVRISACQAPFEAKDRLKGRGYRWNAAHRVWQIELPEVVEEAELTWLALEAACTRPRCERVTWHSRYR